MIGGQYPAEVVVQLQIGRFACRLRHGANDAGQLGGRTSAQQDLEDVAQSADMMQIIENDDGWQIVIGSTSAGRLLGDMAEILVQLLRRLAVGTVRIQRRELTLN